MNDHEYNINTINNQKQHRKYLHIKRSNSTTNGHPPVIKHRNGEFTICRCMSHWKPSFGSGISQPCLIRLDEWEFQDPNFFEVLRCTYCTNMK